MTPLPGSSTGPQRPNTAFRRLRGQLSAAEFAATVRRAAREIGEQVSCDARYIGRVESGAIRCPNYAYERVFRHMFPGHTLTDLGFVPREAVRGHAARSGGRPPAPPPPATPGPRPRTAAPPPAPDGPPAADPAPTPPPPSGRWPDSAPLRPSRPSRPDAPPWDPLPAGPYPTGPCPPAPYPSEPCKESDVLRRAFMTGGPAAVTAPTWGGGPARSRRRVGEPEAAAVEEAVRHIRLFDDRFGADGLYARAARPLRTAYALLDSGTHRPGITERLQTGAGELAISVGWLAHDCGRFGDARSYYAEALATARVADDRPLEAHAFSNIAFLARDAGRPREAVRAAQAAQEAARRLASPRLLSLLALREAGGWAGLADRAACQNALLRAESLFGRGPSAADPEWMSFYGEAELAGLEAQCWAALGDWPRAAEHARRAVALQDPHFTRNIALFTVELARDLAGGGRPDEAAAAGGRTVDLLGQVRSGRVRAMLDGAAHLLRPHRRSAAVADFLSRHAALGRPASLAARPA
ncbi:tetratricopeptide repeat protein [Streptomyces sp. NPDC018031]|uniref:tetratricopeptide repeat protein n=1 Tax=Streptomyces sp. NPDC018031 TaxID=3365033 RepID=UPI00378F4B8E